jgi:pyruvate ferredoxin oxidoreductase beta subunit
MNKDLTKKFAPGHGTCSGCGIPAIVRNILDVSDDPVVVVNATGCLEVTSTLYPYTSWKVPYIHSAFENAGATVSGIEAAYRVLEKKGKIKGKINFVVFGGDGSTYDIGLQALSGALERGHRFLYVGYDNQGYMNTGGQRSGATPYGASMTTTPAAKGDIGNELDRKDIMEIVAAHGLKYLAQANVAHIEDLRAKAKKALSVDGPSFMLVLQPCTNSWKFPISDYVKVAKLAHDTNYWTLYEIENGEYKINQYVASPKPIEEFLKTQKRFKHLLLPENKKVLQEIQRRVDERLADLKKKTGEK